MLRLRLFPKRLPVFGVIITLLAFVVFGGLTGLALANDNQAAAATPAGADPHAGLDMSTLGQTDSVTSALHQGALAAAGVADPHAGINITGPSQPSAADVLMSGLALKPPQQVAVSDPSKQCAGCHADVLKTWTGSPHNLAFSNDKFQQAWEAQNKNSSCLQCHTTNFSPATGQYEAEGISCVACHGEIPSDHPKTPVNLDKANTVCKDCHTVTFAEFRASLHNDKGLQCTSCHYAHQNGLRLGDQVTQCTNCHKNQLDDFAHESHINAGLVCRNCHGYVDPNQEVPVDGLVPTGHDFRESTHACLNCHQNIHLTASDSGTTQDFSTSNTQQASLHGEQATLRISELETAYKTLVLQNRNANLIGVLEGGVGGLVVGGAVIWLFDRRRRALKDDGDTDAH